MRAVLLSGALVAAAAGCADGCEGTVDDFPDYFPELGEIPDGHVYFLLSYELGDCTQEAIYAQENRMAWRDDAGVTHESEWQEWVWFEGRQLAPDALEAQYLNCACTDCQPGCNVVAPAIGTVFEVAPNHGLLFDWDGQIWSREQCDPETACTLPRPAAPGRYTVQFFVGWAYRHSPDYTDYRIDGSFEVGTVEFEYPRDQVVWYAYSCPEGRSGTR
ncbi:MAG: hypothetical protein HY905_00785 [Deltaproteobacteria bacterium]|nr:hypothetical protein [Deltaproteobacteria bacterium]